MKRGIKITCAAIVFLIIFSACERKFVPPPLSDLTKRPEVDLERKGEEEKRKEEEKKKAEKKKAEEKAKAELQKENYTTYFDEKSGWNVYETRRENIVLKFKYPKDWIFERKEHEESSVFKSPDVKYSVYESQIDGMKIELRNLGLGYKNMSLEWIRGDFGPIGPMIEEKKFYFTNEVPALLSTWEGNWPNEEKEPGVVRITSRLVFIFSDNAYSIDFATGGDDRYRSYDFFKKLIQDFEFVKS